MHLLPFQTLTGRTSRRRHVPGTFFRCSRCGITKPCQDSGETGYAKTRRGALVCYGCCGDLDRRQMIRDGKACLYLNRPVFGDEKAPQEFTVSNWPGSLKLRAHARKSRHNWRNVDRWDCWFTGPDGRQWYGVNLGDSQIVRCRRLKA